MHDPMVVAHEIALPWPVRKPYCDARTGERRWTLGRHRRTNLEDLGEPTYPWWRPAGYGPRAAGRAFALYRLATVWHVEPGGRDSGTVCPHSRRWQDEDGKWHYEPLRGWRWHVWHWRIQLHPWQAFRQRFERCDECGRRMNRATRIGVGWDDPRVLHDECHALRHLRGTLTDTDALVDRMFAAFRAVTDSSEEQALRALLGSRWGNNLWRAHYRLRQRLRDDTNRRETVA